MIKVAIVGTGGISHAHINAWMKFPERCKIVALVDIIPGKAQRVKEQYQLDADVYPDHHDILPLDIDVVDVCTPPFSHAEISINALRNGKNVVCEKPMAASLQECDEMLRARDESGKRLSIIAQNRFREPIRNLKALLDSGMAGKIRSAQINSFWFRGHSYYDLWWRGTWEKEGGGCTLNHAVHHIDMLGWMMGLPERVTSVLANTGHDNAEVEDLSVSIMEYPGALATVTASVVHHGEEQELIFQCEKAKVSAPYDVFASIPQPNGFPLKEPDMEFRKRADEFVRNQFVALGGKPALAHPYSFTLKDCEYLWKWFSNGERLVLNLDNIPDDQISFTPGDSCALLIHGEEPFVLTKSMLLDGIRACEGSVEVYCEKILGKYAYIEVQLWDRL